MNFFALKCARGVKFDAEFLFCELVHFFFPLSPFHFFLRLGSVGPGGRGEGR